MMRRCVVLIVLVLLLVLVTRSEFLRTEHEHEHDYEEESRSFFKNDSPCPWSFSSNFCVQSQSQHAHGSVPFSCRQLRRECASFTLSKSKYSSQYGRSSASGGSQKQVSTHAAIPAAFTRACCMLCMYSSPAIEPQPSVCWSIAWIRAGFFPALTRAFTRYRIGENIS